MNDIIGCISLFIMTMYEIKMYYNQKCIVFICLMDILIVLILFRYLIIIVVIFLTIKIYVEHLNIFR